MRSCEPLIGVSLLVRLGAVTVMSLGAVTVDENAGISAPGALIVIESPAVKIRPVPKTWV